jgi:hypothetical protein
MTKLVIASYVQCRELLEPSGVGRAAVSTPSRSVTPVTTSQILKLQPRIRDQVNLLARTLHLSDTLEELVTGLCRRRRCGAGAPSRHPTASG